MRSAASERVPGREPSIALREALDGPDIGAECHALAARIYPIGRSIAGPALRHTLAVLRDYAPLTTVEVPTGTQVLDWTVPREWELRDAYVKSSDGRRVIDVLDSTLSVVSYSSPVRARMSLAELRPHLHTHASDPDLIPYRTTYYRESWGFCLPQRVLASLPEDTYEVVIDSTISDGSMTLGEYVHAGESEDEVLFNAHTCHPSLASETCAGLAVLTLLAQALSRVRTRLSYRFVFAPATIGGIAWLALNEQRVHRVKHGLVVACLGDAAGPRYKRSRRGNALVDRAMTHLLRHAGPAAVVKDFEPFGYDERQFCSPGFDLPVGLLQRSETEHFPEYHSSADNLDFITPQALAQSYRLIVDLIDILEHDRKPLSLSPKGEPRLGPRGLHSPRTGSTEDHSDQDALMWVLSFADGNHSLLDIAERAGMPFSLILAAERRLQAAGLIAGEDRAP